MSNRPRIVSDADDMLNDLEEADKAAPGVVTDLNRPLVLRMSHVHQCRPEWIARQLGLEVEDVVAVIEASKT